ncbi:MAG: ABC transporter ATP-binding protein [Oscillospiraceae bacterium]|nr:ABC transporter ATP-binding protein [Oscillospiraceae bacterium]
MKKDPVNNKPDSASTGSWREFFYFIKNAGMSWGWIVITIIVTMVYYLTCTRLPGSTAALFSGTLTRNAIMDVVINYSSLLVAMALVSTVSLIAEARTVRSVRRIMWKRMMCIRSDYYDEHNAGELLSAVTIDTQTSVTMLIQLIVTTPGLILYLSRALPLINGFSPKLMWSVLILIPFYILYAFLMGRWQYKIGRRIQVRIGGLTGYLTDRIRNLTMIKTFVTEREEEEKGVAASKELYRANVDYSYVNSVIVAYTILAEVLGIVIAVIWGCYLLRNGEIDMQSWLTFFLFVPTINTVLRQLTNIWSNLKDVQGRAARLGGLMQAPLEDLNESADVNIPDGDICFENVSFAYREGAPVLKNISFTLPRGKVTAVVGLSGSGKTTILRLLEKLYTPQSGRITVGGVPLEELNLCSWRDRLSYVNQDAEMFSGTVREAMAYGIRREVGEEYLRQAAHISGIEKFISESEEGYETELAIWGSTMSGGQRQRLIIARELLRDADTLLLDEATSALDPETALAISDTFFCGFGGKTVVAVTHELGFITQADRIIVISNGTVNAEGTHSELMEKCDIYRRLVEEQSYQEVFAK